ncbi:tRNA dihydrouridine(20/20a) synthase DusA [Pseudomonas sp. RP23018S]|uniref:tRNA dihydrouridine(20/20a) synthase DusA n=1 Tax=Pseudomonas sp. RP23018S TaxID=3096037 RepID=UPI002ACA7AD6|nr:tRNA dihydrouridine(20/20a) synthase DusA [Pseudomonas sp. RP23018S]MDZ5601805.1 tRNA dihydrouridine(20/20a) synthase DusA [Pseudomonas sp. RP23018S]
MPLNTESKPATTHPEPCRRFSVAPMMDWTDRHCRFFLRLLSKQTLLYTEMVTTGALLHNDAHRFLQHHETEHPLALQLGGSTPADLAACAKLAEAAGYDEVNLNVGCPSDRVQNNMIGACLMAHPALVADCVKAMRDAVATPVTVKHRIGINGRDGYAELCDFVGQVRDAGCRSFTVHARIAILEGLSPKENREVPPLRYDVAAQLKADFPDLEIVLNGGIKTLDACEAHLQTFDGVMLGREAYHNPYLLAEVDQRLFGSAAPVITRAEALAQLRPYIVAHIESGGAMHHVTRHILGLGQGFAGARRFRQLLSSDIHKHPQPLVVLDQAAELLAGR